MRLLYSSKALVLTLGLLLVIAFGKGANRYSVVTGNWNSTSTWSTSSGGAAGASFPVVGDDVIIEGGYTVTVTANAACNSITFNPFNPNKGPFYTCTLTVNNTFTLSVTDAVTLNNAPSDDVTAAISGGGTLTCALVRIGGIDIYPTGQNTTNSHTLTCTINALTVSGNLTINSDFADNSRVRNGVFTQISGTVTVNGSLTTNNSHHNSQGFASSIYTLGNSSPTLILGGANPFTISTQGTSTITLNGTGATVLYNNSGAQVCKATSYNNLTLSGNGIKTTTGITVNGILSMEGAATTALTGTLIYGPAATLVYKGSIAQITGAEFPSTWTGSGGVKIENASGVTLNAIRSISATPLVISSIVANSKFNDGGFQLTSTGALNIFTTGTFKLGAATATAFPAFVTPIFVAGTTVEYAAMATQIVKGLSYNNLTISGTGNNSKTADANITVNGILNLSSANASATQGSLDMGTFILAMGATATTVGTGDVTGIVNRAYFLVNTPYSFGNKFTTMNFAAGGTLPTSVSFKIVLTTSHTWKSDAVHRYYDIIQTAGDNATKVTLNLHYLDSELNGATEGNLDMFDNIVAGSIVEDHGQSNFSTTDNWVGLANMILIHDAPSSTFNNKYWTLGTSRVPGFTWIGTSIDWTYSSNWVGSVVPTLNDHVVIPDGSTTLYDPVLPTSTTIGSIIIQSAGILNGGTGTTLTVAGGAGAWYNSGTFNAGSNTVVFTNAAATMAGSTDFYNVTVANGASMTVGTNNIMRIAGALSLLTTGILNASNDNNSIEYNSTADQTVIYPNGSTTGYHDLILSGSGIKTMPSSAMTVYGDCSISGTTIATLAGTLTVGGNLTIANGCKLSVAPTSNLTVLGTLTSNVGAAGFVLQSNITGTASLIYNTNNVPVPATVQRYIGGLKEDWHFLSSPVAAQNFDATWLPAGSYANGTGYDLYLWYETKNCWIYKLNIDPLINWFNLNTTSYFIPGRGYLYSLLVPNQTMVFTGNLNNGYQSFPITSKPVVSDPEVNKYKGFNLVGNPYPSAIDWKKSSGWTRGNLEISNEPGDVPGNFMWIWNPTVNGYGIFNSLWTDGGTLSATRYIAPMQGFFVKALTDGALAMDNSVRVHDVTSPWKSTKQEVVNVGKVSLIVKSDAGIGSDEIQLRFGYSDNGNGAMKMFSRVASSPNLYMVAKGNELSVIYLTNTKENSAVPVKFVPGVTGNYTFDCSFDQNNFETVKLEDRQMHTIQNMKTAKTYRFKALKTDDVNRFVLYFGPVNSPTGYELPARIYNDGTHLIIDLTLIAKETNIIVYDIMGRIVLQQKLQGGILHNLNINTQTQMLVVKLKNPDGSLSRKLMWVR